MIVGNFAISCIVSNFYIKSQHGLEVGQELVGCIVSNFYIKSQLDYGT